MKIKSPKEIVWKENLPKQLRANEQGQRVTPEKTIYVSTHQKPARTPFSLSLSLSLCQVISYSLQERSAEIQESVMDLKRGQGELAKDQ